MVGLAVGCPGERGSLEGGCGLSTVPCHAQFLVPARVSALRSPLVCCEASQVISGGAPSHGYLDHSLAYNNIMLAAWRLVERLGRMRGRVSNDSDGVVKECAT